jgi:hypothetical protein
MAERTTYITVRLDIHNPKTDEITDEDIQDVITEMDYHFEPVGDFELETEICGINE